MSARRQTYPTIALHYAPDEITGAPTWTLNVSDGDSKSLPVKVSPETAAGIAQMFDVALPLPIELGGQPTSAERVVRAAHVQTLAAQLAAAEAGLKATAPDRASALPRPVPAAPPVAPAAAPVRAPRARRAPAAAAVVEPVTPLTVVKPQGPVLETAPVDVVLPDAEPPARYEDAPEHLPRRSHLDVPVVDQF